MGYLQRSCGAAGAHTAVCQLKLLLLEITLQVKENAKSAIPSFSLPLSLSLSFSVFVSLSPKRGIIRYMLPVLTGGVISLAQLTVCDVHFFLKSKEHDLFSLLFLSDLIGHSSHIHEWHL